MSKLSITTRANISPIKQKLWHMSIQWRRLTAAQRQLPAFLIIGVQKGGTSSLYHYLSQHQQIVPALRKETHFFDFHYSDNIGRYRLNFPFQPVGFLQREKITGEATPNYFFDPNVPQRVAATLPNVKLIVLLRDPVERAYSHYLMAVRRGKETLSFAHAITAEPQRLSDELAGGWSNSAEKDKAHHWHSYLARGRYAEQLERWFEHFPRSRFLILDSTQFFKETEPEYDRVLTFLGLKKGGFSNFKVKNRNRSSQATPLDKGLRERLQTYFHPHNVKLAQLTQMEFAWA